MGSQSWTWLSDFHFWNVPTRWGKIWVQQISLAVYLSDCLFHCPQTDGLDFAFVVFVQLPSCVWPHYTVFSLPPPLPRIYTPQLHPNSTILVSTYFLSKNSNAPSNFMLPFWISWRWMTCSFMLNADATGGASPKESACQCRRCKRCGFHPGVGEIPWSRKWQPTSVILPGKFHGRKSLPGYSPWGCEEPAASMTEWQHSPSSLTEFIYLSTPSTGLPENQKRVLLLTMSLASNLAPRI